ncbi:HNH endonuclease [Deinococcus yavapaiensis]|uniref:5-methylcytosine-specific restriction protein A n=1 Tax=Deinococcus yavapaiensis KR-236 TaxID=694435 RepID=A0A318S5V2_9DEIO|nr:HNH endonuclease [Deinococcus yavapaiensis]PYE52985.1 5-methylcytosine-specific restriction protein A [Deinococcus yavapaiensis KR-236]
MKIANLAYFDEANGGGGLRGGGKGDRVVWDTYAHRSEELRRLTDVVRGAREDVPPLVDVDEGFPEGRIVERLHKSRERSRTLVRAKLADVSAKTGRLACEACGFDFEATYGDAARGMAECHHRVPLSAIGQSKTTLADLAVVCANCHRYLHRVRPMPTVEELRLALASHGT